MRAGTTIGIAADYADVSDPELAYGLKLLNEFHLRKIAALDTLLRFLSLGKSGPKPLTGDMRVAFIQFTAWHVRHAKYPAQAIAGKVLLNWLCPGWQAEEPELFGILAERHSPESWAWRKAVLMRDAKACRACGSTYELHAHHIIGWAKAPSLRLEISNGVTLCKTCHRKYHSNPLVQIWH